VFAISLISLFVIIASLSYQCNNPMMASPTLLIQALPTKQLTSFLKGFVSFNSVLSEEIKQCLVDGKSMAEGMAEGMADALLPQVLHFQSDLLHKQIPHSCYLPGRSAKASTWQKAAVTTLFLSDQTGSPLAYWEFQGPW
jgi:hypothetical protein